MASNVDLALDDIISKNKKSNRGTGNRRGGRGNARGMGNRGNRGTSRGRGGISRGGGQRGGGIKTAAFRNQRTNINGKWSHDMYYGGATGNSNASRSISTGPTKLNITNLDYGVSDSDIKELFSEFGNMRAAAVHYDRSGRSLGTAHVLFERRSDGLKAIKQYNGVHLDGRPMNIIIDGESSGVSNGGGAMNGGSFRGARGVGRNVKRLQGAPRGIGGGARGRTPRGGAVRGRGRGGRSTRGGRGAKTKVTTAEELDAELDAYVVQGAK